MNKRITIYFDENVFSSLIKLKKDYHINISSFVSAATKEKLEKEENIKK